MKVIGSLIASMAGLQVPLCVAAGNTVAALIVLALATSVAAVVIFSD